VTYKVHELRKRHWWPISRIYLPM